MVPPKLRLAARKAHRPTPTTASPRSVACAARYTSFVIEGIKSNLPFHRKLVDHPDFIAGKLDTHFLERFKFV